MAERTCKVCGEGYDAALTECPWCGAPAAAEEKPAFAETPDVPPGARVFALEEEEPEEHPGELREGAAPRKKGRRRAIAVCALALVSAVAGLLGWRLSDRVPEGPFTPRSAQSAASVFLGTGYLPTVSDAHGNTRGAALLHHDWIMDLGHLDGYVQSSVSDDGAVAVFRDMAKFAYSSSSWYDGALSGGEKETGPQWLLYDHGTVTAHDEWTGAAVTGDGKTLFYMTADEEAYRLFRRDLTAGEDREVVSGDQEYLLLLTGMSWDGSVICYMSYAIDQTGESGQYVLYDGEEPIRMENTRWIYNCGTAEGAIFGETVENGKQYGLIGWRKDGELAFRKVGRVTGLVQNRDMTELLYKNEDGLWYETADGARLVEGLPEGFQFCYLATPRSCGNTASRLTDWVYQYYTGDGSGLFYLDRDLNIRVLVEPQLGETALTYAVDERGRWLVYRRGSSFYRIEDVRDPYSKVTELGSGFTSRATVTLVPGERACYCMDSASAAMGIYYLDKDGRKTQVTGNARTMAVLGAGSCWFQDQSGKLCFTKNGGQPLETDTMVSELMSMTGDFALAVSWDEGGDPAGWRLDRDGTMTQLEEATYGTQAP